MGGDDSRKGNPNRRSMYLQQTRTRPVTFLHVFDAPDMTSDNQSQRFRSALPIQSLALMNSPLMMRVSSAFAQKLLEQTKGSAEEAIMHAFDTAYGRDQAHKSF